MWLLPSALDGEPYCIGQAKKHFEFRSPTERFRSRVKKVYDSRWVVGFVGSLILAVYFEKY